MSSLVAVTSRKGIIISYKPLIKTKSILVSGEIVVSYSDKTDICSLVEKNDGVCLEISDYVIPAFVDPHVHPDSLGFEIELSAYEEIRNRFELYDALRRNPIIIGEWVLARFDHLLYHDRKPPTRMELDSVFPNTPVLMIHRSGHFGVLNTIGLKLAKDYIEGGSGVDFGNGFVYERDLMILRERVLSKASDESLYSSLRKALDHFLSNGVLSIGVAGSNYRILNLLKSMDASGDLEIRTYVYLFFNGFDIENVVRDYVESRLKSRKLRVNGVKVILDGALGPRTAYLSKPYSDDPSTSGLLLLDQEALRKIAFSANKYGLQLAVHAIGDAALDIVLEVYENLNNDVERFRHRVEHVSLVRNDQLEKISKLKPVLVVQPHFVLSDTWIHERVGDDRLSWAYRFATLNKLTTLAFSTDAPVEPVNPWRTLYAATNRGFARELPLSKHTLNERMNILDALHSYTKLAGYALRDDRLGSLTPGSYADFIIVDKDPTETSNLEELLNIRVLDSSIRIMRGY